MQFCLSGIEHWMCFYFGNHNLLYNFNGRKKWFSLNYERILGQNDFIL